MTNERYNYLMRDDDAKLTKEEMELGWHFCSEWDCLLIGPDFYGELECCQCLPNNHPVYNYRKDPQIMDKLKHPSDIHLPGIDPNEEPDIYRAGDFVDIPDHV
jgi:hypothetical protein